MLILSPGAIPEFKLSTAYARSVLPAQVSRADAVFSGSGPTLLAFAHGANQAIASALHQTLQRHGIACQIRPLQADTTGAVVL